MIPNMICTRLLEFCCIGKIDTWQSSQGLMYLWLFSAICLFYFEIRQRSSSSCLNEWLLLLQPQFVDELPLLFVVIQHFQIFQPQYIDILPLLLQMRSYCCFSLNSSTICFFSFLQSNTFCCVSLNSSIYLFKRAVPARHNSWTICLSL